MTHIGFHVWNPAGRLPTRTHPDLQSAVTEAERLTRENPGQTFVVMAPVLTAKDAWSAQAFSEGVKEGKRQREPMIAELREQLKDLRAARDAMASAARLISGVDEHQAIVADCLLWFDGFSAAYVGKETYEQPRIPNRDNIKTLNAALQQVMRAKSDAGAGGYRTLDDSEIPF